MECLNQHDILYENIQNNAECYDILMMLKDSLKTEDFKYIPKLLDELKNDYEANKNRIDFLTQKIEYALPNTQLVNEIKKDMPNCNDEDIPKEVLKNNVFTREIGQMFENLQGEEEVKDHIQYLISFHEEHSKTEINKKEATEMKQNNKPEEESNKDKDKDIDKRTKERFNTIIKMIGKEFSNVESNDLTEETFSQLIERIEEGKSKFKSLETQQHKQKLQSLFSFIISFLIIFILSIFYRNNK